MSVASKWGALCLYDVGSYIIRLQCIGTKLKTVDSILLWPLHSWRSTQSALPSSAAAAERLLVLLHKFYSNCCRMSDDTLEQHIFLGSQFQWTSLVITTRTILIPINNMILKSHCAIFLFYFISACQRTVSCGLLGVMGWDAWGRAGGSWRETGRRGHAEDSRNIFI